MNAVETVETTHWVVSDAKTKMFYGLPRDVPTERLYHDNHKGF